MQSLAIILLSILMAVRYGIVHDQFTARVCVEYFTIGHPPVFATQDPTLLGIGWGIIATWWVGLIMGVPLAIAARFGNRPKCDASSLVRPLFWLAAASALGALAAGIAGWLLALGGVVELAGYLAQEVPPDCHARYLADGFAHRASYAGGFLGGTLVIVHVWRSRGKSIGAT